MTYSKRKTGFSRLLLFMLTLMLVGGMSVPLQFMTADRAGAASQTYNFTTNGGARFSVNGMTGICCQSGVGVKSKGTATVTRISNNTPAAKVAYYYGYAGGFKFPSTHKSGSWGKLKVLMQWAGHEMYGNKTPTGGRFKSDYNTIKAKAAPPATFYVYKGSPERNQQDFIAWKMTQPVKLTLVKTSTNPTISKQNGANFSGIKYQVYKSDKKTKAGILTCTASGKTNTVTSSGHDAGVYYAKEIATNKHYKLNSEWLKVTVAEGKTGTFQAKDTPVNKQAQIQVVKASKDKNATKTGYTFAGIQYTIYKSDKKTKVQTLTLPASGKSPKSKYLPLGTYYIKETKTNKWFKLDSTWKTATLTTNGQLRVVKVSDTPNPGTISIVKKLSDGKTSNETYTFTLTNKKSKAIKYTIKVKGDGKAVSKTVLAGTYTIKETIPSGAEYSIDVTGTQTKTIAPGGKITVTHVNEKDVPEPKIRVNKTTDDGGKLDGFTFKITKKVDKTATLENNAFIEAASPALDAQTSEQYTAGEWAVSENGLAALNNAAHAGEPGEYTINVTTEATPKEEGGSAMTVVAPVKVKLTAMGDEAKVENVSASSAEHVTFNNFDWSGASDVGKSWTMVTDENGKGKTEKGQEMIRESDGLTFGTYTITEVLTDEQAKRYKQAEPQTKTITEDSTSATFNVENKGILVPAKIKKTSADGKVSGIDFKITGKTTWGEDVERIETTDSDGLIDLGELSPGEYVVEEVTFDAENYDNPYPLEGYTNPAQKFTITGDEGEQGVTFNFENVPFAKILLTKVDKESHDFLSGSTFDLVNTDSGETEATFKVIKNEDGVPAVQMIKSIDRIKAIDNAELQEDLAHDDGSSAISNDEEINDSDGDGGTPSDNTDNTDSNTDNTDSNTDNTDNGTDNTGNTDSGDGNTDNTDSNTDSGNGNSDATDPTDPTDDDLLDDIDIGLGGHLMKVLGIEKVNAADEENSTDTTDVTDPTDNTDADGTDASNSSNNGSDSEANNDSNATQTTYEYVMLTGLKSGAKYDIVESDAPSGWGIAENISIDASHDEIQKIIVVDEASKIATTAIDKATNSHTAYAGKDTVIVDTVKYENLIPGREYTVKGRLMDKTAFDGDTKDVVPVKVDGKEVTSSTKFTPKTPNGEVQLEFKFDASAYAGSNLVVYEKLFIGESEITSHEDPNDKEQTVNVPKIGTVATDKETNNNIGNADNNVTVIDTIMYSGLTPGQKYTAKGELMYKSGKSTGQKAQVTFTPKNSEGQVELAFHFNGAKIAGNTLVAFEEVYDANNKIVGEHKDINDKAQAVVYPKLKTTALDKASNSHNAKAGKVTIVDKVEYSNLIVGQEYVVEGVLMDATTEKSTGVTAKTAFKPDKSSGSVNMEFNVDASKLAGHKLVAFEELKMKPVVGAGETTNKMVTVGEHKDLNDNAQTVNIGKGTIHQGSGNSKNSPSSNPKTGQSIPWILGGLGVLLAIAGVYVFRNRKTIFGK